MVQGRKSWLCSWKVYVFFDVGRDHEHSMNIAPADRAGEIGDLKQLDPFLLLRLGEALLQKLPHLVKTDVIECRSENTADDADHHAPCCHIKIGDLDHQPNGFCALAFPGRRK